MTTDLSGFQINDFVVCKFKSDNGKWCEGFGFITNVNNDYYVIELVDQKGFASVPIDNIRYAGRA